MWKDLSKICEILNKNNIQYLIIGGTCVTFHGYSRSTTLPNGQQIDKHDFDIWYRPTLSNYVNLIKVLKTLNFDFEEDYTKFENYRKEYNDYNLDFLPKPFEEIDNGNSNKLFIKFYNERDISDSTGIDINFLNIDDLIYLKSLSKREKDIKDLIELNKIKKD